MMGYKYMLRNSKIGYNWIFQRIYLISIVLFLFFWSQRLKKDDFSRKFNSIYVR